jgi:hypothetical protein
MSTPHAPVAVGPLRLVAHDGGRAAVNDQGQILLCTSPGALTLRSGGVERVIARARSFGGFDLADDGRCLYRADGGLYLSTPDGQTRIGQRYHGFAQPSLVTWQAGDGGPRHLAAYVARRPDGHKVAVLHPSHADPVECFATGTTIGGELVEDFRVSRLGLALCCVATLRGRHGRYRKALIVDANNAVSGDRIVEGEEIRRLSSRAAVNVQMGFVKAFLRDGGEALHSRPPLMAAPEALLRTGELLPGEPTARVAHIGAPVASSGIPNTGRFGVAAAVRLDDGRRGVWLGVFGAQHPLHGRAIAPLLDGDHPDGFETLPLRDFVPVKLTNRGALLCWARSERGRVLVLAEGLFDWFGPSG